MRKKEHRTPIRWHSLSLRLSAVFIAVLVAAALLVGYLFDRGRAEAVEKRELEQLRIHAERGADELARFVNQLLEDVLFLANTPPIQGICRALDADGVDVVGNSTLLQWKQRLQQIFHSFAQAKPEYFQLRLIGVGEHGHELIRVERTEAGLRNIPPEDLQQKGERYYFQKVTDLKQGSAYLSRVDLNREHGQISYPHLPTLRAATPVYDSTGSIFGMLVISMAINKAFERAVSFADTRESLYIANEQGDLLLHPEPGRAFAFEAGESFRLSDTFSRHIGRISSTLSKGGGFLEIQGAGSKLAAYLTSRAWDPQDRDRRMVFILTKPMELIRDARGLMHQESLLSMGGALLLAIVLIIAVVLRLTRSLTTLAGASESIAGGDYRIALPVADGDEVGRLVIAFRHMAAEVEKREDDLAALNRDLERRVDERTAELMQQHSLQHLILENIADGIVVADCNGRFLLWNRRAEQIIGSDPGEIQPRQWSSHFGVFRDEAGELVPTEELPLVRAMRGESSDNIELYLRSTKSNEGHWVQVSARPLLDADAEIAGGVAVLVDVTEHKRLRQRLESHRTELAQLGRLALSAEIASSVAHQLSQPIAAMSNYAGALARLRERGRLGGGELGDLLARIENLAQQAGKILDKLRTLIRRPKQVVGAVDINQVAESCLELLAERIQQQGVRVESHYTQDLPMFFGDPIEIEQVLIQLISNALEAMESIKPKERRLSIGTDYDRESALILIEVADTGPGVSPELAERVFEPWQTDKPNALGIGLSIAQTIVENRRGRICMERSDAGGALFRIQLPVGRDSPT